MARIKTLLTAGGTATAGTTEVNSLNVDPTTLVATAAGKAFPTERLRDYDYFNVNQTSADTDFILLPLSTASAPIGTIIYLYAAEVFSIAAASGGTLNGEAYPTHGTHTVTAGDLLICRKVSSTAWIMNALSTVGAITNPIPAS